MVWIKAEVEGTIITAIEDAKDIAGKLGCGVTFMFNDVVMYIKEDTDEKEALKRYKEV